MRAVQMAVDDAYKRAAVEAAAINDAVLRVQLYVECVLYKSHTTNQNAQNSDMALSKAHNNLQYE